MKKLPILAALLIAGIFTALAFRFVTVQTDMAAFLPQGRTPAARYMLQQLQSGSTASLILLGIENAPPDQLATISTKLATTLQATNLFTLVSNGDHTLDGPETQFLFAHRYQLAPPTDFSQDALRTDLQKLLQELQSSATPLVTQYGLPDPTGALPALASIWIGASKIRTIGGVWFAPERDRALLILQTKAPGLDIGAQDDADAAIQKAFAATSPGPARLLESGPAVFGRAAAASIKSDIHLLSAVSSVLVLAFLYWRFRSFAVLAAIAAPMTASVAVAALVTQAAFGYVHGIALGFGMTMLGVTVDYPVLLIGHRKIGESAPGTLHRIGRALALAVLCAAIGLTGMVFSGFPGIAQLGLFAAVGVLTAAILTWTVLARLIAAANLAPVWAGDPGRLLRIESWRRWRFYALVPTAIAAAYLIAHGGPAWEGDIANLSPIPPALHALDEQLRTELGAPDLGSVLVLQGPTADSVLTQQESLLPAIDRLQAQGDFTGYEAAARLLPSTATQRARQSALPDDATLQSRLQSAAAGLPFQPTAFAAFTQAVATARTAPPVTLASFTTPATAARLGALLFQQNGTWFGPIAFIGASHPVTLTAPGAVFVDIHAETNALVTTGTTRALRWLAAGATAALLCMLAGLRQPIMVARIAFAIAAAGLVTVALLTAAGVRLSLLHLVALQFAAGVGLDYALFYARRNLDAEERARTLRTLVTCNALTLLTFGLLAFCRTPLLAAIGSTVAIGAVSAMCFSFFCVGQFLGRDSA